MRQEKAHMIKYLTHKLFEKAVDSGTASRLTRRKSLCMCIYIYVCAVGSISGPHLGGFRVNKGSTL